MKDSALVVVDMLRGGPVDGTLKVIDKLTAGTEADESGISLTAYTMSPSRARKEGLGISALASTSPLWKSSA